MTRSSSRPDPVRRAEQSLRRREREREEAYAAFVSASGVDLVPASRRLAEAEEALRQARSALALLRRMPR